MELLKSSNLALSFAIELAAIIACIYWAYQLPVGGALKIIGAIVAPIVLIAIWTLFFAPQADYRLSMPGLVIGKLILFGVVTGLLYAAGQRSWGFAFGLLAGINTLLAVLLHQE